MTYRIITKDLLRAITLVHIKMEIAILGAGCFWGVEESFRRLPGVIETRVGYSGGHLENPTYKDVCQGDTGHAEVVKITFDPELISYKSILEHFWQIHNPTTRNRQGPDIGHQYRSIIFYSDKNQQKIALESRLEENQSKKYTAPIVTEIVEQQPFYDAEEYHQKYLLKQGKDVCHI